MANNIEMRTAELLEALKVEDLTHDEINDLVATLLVARDRKSEAEDMVQNFADTFESIQYNKFEIRNKVTGETFDPAEWGLFDTKTGYFYPEPFTDFLG